MNPILSKLMWHGSVFKISLLRLKRLNVEWRESGFFLISMGLERHFFAYFFFSPQNHQCRSFQNWHFLQFLKPWFQIWSHQLEISYTNKDHVGVCFSLKIFFSKTYCWSGASSESSVTFNLRMMVVDLKGQYGWAQNAMWLDPKANMVDPKGQYGWP